MTVDEALADTEVIHGEDTWEHKHNGCPSACVLAAEVKRLRADNHRLERVARAHEGMFQDSNKELSRTQARLEAMRQRAVAAEKVVEAAKIDHDEYTLKELEECYCHPSNRPDDNLDGKCDMGAALAAYDVAVAYDSVKEKHGGTFKRLADDEAADQ